MNAEPRDHRKLLQDVIERTGGLGYVVKARARFQPLACHPDSARPRKDLTIAVAVTGILAAVALSSCTGDDNPVALAKALPEASVSLDQGLKASESEGKPISGEYEIEDGALQLLVYTMKGDQFSEVIVDHKTGAVEKAEKITDADDLKDAKEQSQAMAGTKVSLDKVVDDATKANSGYRAVSVMPILDAGKPVANITLMKGEDIKKVMVELD
jgi:hypothetical protein